jgi:hypothetical protein
MRKKKLPAVLKATVLGAVAMYTLRSCAWATPQSLSPRQELSGFEQQFGKPPALPCAI